MIVMNKKNLIDWAEQYRYPDKNNVERRMKAKLCHQRFLTKEDFIEIARWKSPRPIKHYQSNTEKDIQEITKLSFLSDNERARIGLLLSLNGVSYPLASTILHFAFTQSYPIIDFRVLWSIGKKQQKRYTFEYWIDFCNEIRTLAIKTGLDIRTIDKALWQFSKENQPMD